MGSIFGIYEPSEECVVDMDNPEKTLASCITNVCQPGKNLLAAGYCLYSSCTIFVLTIGDGVYGFTLDPYVGEFVLTHERIQIPESGKIYAFNEGNYQLWDNSVKDYINSLKEPAKWGGKPYSARYIGSLVRAGEGGCRGPCARRAPGVRPPRAGCLVTWLPLRASTCDTPPPSPPGG